MTATKTPGEPPAVPAAPADKARAIVESRRKPPFWRNPWRHPWFLEGFTWLYLIWSLVPIVIAVLFSFNNGRSQSAWQGFSWRWYFTDHTNSVLHNPQLHAAVIQTVQAGPVPSPPQCAGVAALRTGAMIGQSSARCEGASAFHIYWPARNFQAPGSRHADTFS